MQSANVVTHHDRQVRVEKRCLRFSCIPCGLDSCAGRRAHREREPGNSEDPFAVRLKRRGEIVGHVPSEIAKICWLVHDRAISTVIVRGCNNLCL